MTQPDLFVPVPDRLGAAPRFSVPKKTRKSQDGDRMAALFLAHPGRAVSALLLEKCFGLRWRTTVSDLRFAPYHMDIQWKPEPYVNAKGKRKQKSFYVYVTNEGE